jgi:hypothetical protein
VPRSRGRITDELAECMVAVTGRGKYPLPRPHESRLI